MRLAGNGNRGEAPVAEDRLPDRLESDDIPLWWPLTGADRDVLHRVIGMLEDKPGAAGTFSPGLRTAIGDGTHAQQRDLTGQEIAASPRPAYMPLADFPVPELLDLVTLGFPGEPPAAPRRPGRRAARTGSQAAGTRPRCAQPVMPEIRDAEGRRAWRSSRPHPALGRPVRRSPAVSWPALCTPCRGRR